MGIIREIVERDAAAWKLTLTAPMLDQLEEYASILLDWNTRMNLTAIKEPEGVAVRHFADSLTLLAAVDLPRSASVIDVGTGAGFPGMVLKIVRPDLKLTLLDSLNKRLIFLDALKTGLGLDADLVHLRAEDGGRRPQLRDQFDLVTARAVAPLNVLCEWCLPYGKPGGRFAAMKGPEAGEEAAGAAKAIHELNGVLEGKRDFTLSDGSKRTILLIGKKGKRRRNIPERRRKSKRPPYKRNRRMRFAWRPSANAPFTNCLDWWPMAGCPHSYESKT